LHLAAIFCSLTSVLLTEPEISYILAPDKNGGLFMIEMIIFILTVFLLTGYMLYCLKTRNEHPGLLTGMRVTSLAALIVMLATGILWWGIRWILLLAVLSIITLISVIHLLRHSKSKTFRRRRTVLGWAGMVILFVIAMIPAFVFPQYHKIKPTGSYAIAVTNDTYTDKTRIETYTNRGEHRKINVKFWYPEQGRGKYPLVVFSHGFGGVQDSDESTFEELASHGYVVCSIGHPYESLYTVDTTGKVVTISSEYIREFEQVSDNRVTNLKLFQTWMNIRVKDMNLAIDSILAKHGGVYDMVDHHAIGVFGHSMGGAAAMGVPRMRQDIRAVINLDAPMFCELTGVKDGKYTINQKPYPAPLLNIYSEFLYDNAIEKNDPEYFENRIVSATAPASYEVYFRGTQHMNLTDLVLCSPFLADQLNSGRKATADKYQCIETMNQMILGFFNCYLKGQGEFHYKGAY